MFPTRVKQWWYAVGCAVSLCDGLAAADVLPSPKLQLRAVMLPLSVLRSVKLTLSPLAAKSKAATGAVLAFGSIVM